MYGAGRGMGWWAGGRAVGVGGGLWAGMGGGWAHHGLGAATAVGAGVSRATVAIATLLRSYHRQEKSSFIISTDLPKLTLVCPLDSTLVLAQLGAASHPCLAWLAWAAVGLGRAPRSACTELHPPTTVAVLQHPQGPFQSQTFIVAHESIRT